jgi:hypothetical protein
MSRLTIEIRESGVVHVVNDSGLDVMNEDLSSALHEAMEQKGKYQTDSWLDVGHAVGVIEDLIGE